MKITLRRALAGGSALLIVAATLSMVLPAGADTPSAVRLHLASDGRYFAYGSTVQNLSTGGDCRISSPEGIIDLQTSAGLGPDGIGVKTGGSNGTPCSQVEGSEVLTIAKKSGGALGTRSFRGVTLDLELTKNALVKLAFSPAAGGSPVTYTLQTGSNISAAQTIEPGYDTTAPYEVNTDVNLAHDADLTDACASPNSSGPNSGSSDNCRWTVYPAFEFTTFTLRATSGTVSLEGAGDFGGAAAHETLLHLANSAPTATNDSFTTNEDTNLNGNVLSNDTDPDGNALTAVKLSNPAHGTLVLNANGTFTYDPNDNYFGSDSFTYKANDGVVDSNLATVNITVTAVNDPPQRVDGTGSTNEDTKVTITVATDVDSTALVAECTSTPSGATIVDKGNGTVDVTPPLNFFGSLTISCKVTDDAGASTNTNSTIIVGVTGVNDAPVANPDSADVDQDVSGTSDTSVDINVLANDVDVELTPLTIVNIVVPPADLAGGASATVVAGKIRYTPPEGVTGTKTFTYKAFDGAAASNVATVTVEVFPVMCSGDTVATTPPDAPVSGSFTRLTDLDACKRYTLEADQDEENVLFAPQGGGLVRYRGFVTLGPDDAPVVGGSGVYGLLLRYDQDGDLDVGPGPEPVPWCADTELDGSGLVTEATIPFGHSWCIASERTKSVGPAPPDLVTEWQVYGEDDPRFTR